MKLNFPYIILFNTNVSYLESLIPKINDKIWYKNTFRQELYNVHNKTLSIVFKWSSNSNELIDKSIIDYNIINTPLGKEISKQVEKIQKYYPNTFISKAMLAYLPPKSEILNHKDAENLEKVHRIHLPIITNSKCVFNIDGTDYFFKTGECFEFDNTRSHFVKNMGETPRIHLILDLIK